MVDTKLLVIDDDVGMCETLVDIFREKDYSVATVPTASEAIDKAEETAFDAALIDVRLPDMDGTDLLRIFKEYYPEMAGIIITGYGSFQNAIKAFEAGASGFFVKPLVMKDVIFGVEEALERQRLQRELRESEELYRSLVETSPDAVTVSDLEGHIIEVSQQTLEQHGFKSTEEIIGKDGLELVAPEDRKKAMMNIQNTIKIGVSKNVEYTLLRKNGTRFLGEINASLIKDSDGKPKALIINTRDITERKCMEEQVKASLKEKEVLLREIHHRVKNNLQIIISLLRLQSGFLKEKQSVEMFKVSQERIKSMALIHEKLHQSNNLARFDFGGYIRVLTTYLFRSSELSASAILLDINVEDVSLDINKAIPCGLIINELVSNALKHAFPEGKKGKIRIDMHSHKKGQYTLIVSDNGIGFPKDIDFRNTESLGMQLVNDLIGQLKGSIDLDRKSGTTVELTFMN